MAGYVKGSEAERRNKIRRYKEWAVFRGLLVEGYSIKDCTTILDKPLIYLITLFDEFCQIPDVKELC